MYHRFDEAKYPSTNIQLEVFKEQLKIIENLGDNPGDWSKEINKLIKKDSNAALALLFSDKAPQSKIINKARRLILERESCL